MEAVFATDIVKNNYEAEYELERGKPLPSLNHSILENHIGSLLKFKYRHYTVGTELSLELPTGKATPDVYVLEKQKIDWNNDIVKYPNPPLVVIEILSPKQSLTDIKDKIFDIYLPAGVKSCWLVIPPLRTVSVYDRTGVPITYMSGLIQIPELGIELDVADIFDV